MNNAIKKDVVMSTGKRAARWRNGTKPDVILGKIKKVATVTEDNRVQFSGMDYFDDDALLHGSIDYGENLSFDVKQIVRSKAVTRWVTKGKFTSADFIGELNKAINDYLVAEDRDFIVVSSLSVESDGVPFRIVRLPESTIKLYGSLPKKFATRSSHKDRWSKLFPSKSDLPETYTAVAISLRAKHKSDAITKAFHDLDYVRGLLALSIVPGNSFTLGAQQDQRPLNRVMLGGLHSLHDANGQLVDADQFWYEPNYFERQAINVSDRKDRIRREFQFYRNGISRAIVGDRKILEDSVIRYARALDETDRNIVILKLWSALEHLVVHGEQKPEELISRCAFVFSNDSYVEQVLRVVRACRNDNVHKGIQGEGLDSYCYQLHRIFRNMLGFYISRLKRFESTLEKVNEFLDLPASTVSLEQRLVKVSNETRLLKMALRFRGGSQ